MSIARNAKKKMALLLIGLLIALAGCRSVGGLDLEKAVMGQLMAESLEGRMEITLDLEQDGTRFEGTDPETAEIVRALDGIKLVLDEIKLESLNTGSIKGEIVLDRGEIPFHAYMDGSRVILSVEGSNRPIEFSMEESGMPVDGMFGGGFGATDSELRDTGLLQTVGSLLFKHLDNPDNLSVRRVNESVNGKLTSLYKVHAEVRGPEMLELFKGLLYGLVKDDEGLKEAIAVIHDIMVPELTTEDDPNAGNADDDAPHDADIYEGETYGNDSANDESYDDGYFYDESHYDDDFDDSYVDDPFFDNLFFGFFSGENRELKIELMHATIKQALLFLLIAMEEGEGMFMPDVYRFFTEDTAVFADLYYDGSLNLSKQQLELTLAPELSEWGDDAGIRSATLTVAGEYWNHNGDVEAEMPEMAEEAYPLSDLESPDDAWLQQLDKQSVLYRWLKYDMHAMRKTVSFTVVPDDTADTDDTAEWADGTEDWEDWEDWDEWWWYPIEERPLLLDGTMVVPARYYADSLGLDLEWNDAAREVTLTGGDPETVIIMAVDSTVALVNGAETEMNVPVTLQNGLAYIPLRFVSDALGADIEWFAETDTAVVTLD